MSKKFKSYGFEFRGPRKVALYIKSRKGDVALAVEEEFSTWSEVHRMAQLVQDLSGNSQVYGYDAVTGEELFILYRR